MKYVFPTSPGQRRVWFHARMRPDLPIYNSPCLLRLRGPLRVDALERALDAVVARHDGLRASFAVRDGVPVQVVDDEARAGLAVVEAGSEAEAERLAEAEARRPFDLAAGPLLRAVLLRLGPDRHDLLLVVHHVVFDAWSQDVLLRELAALYGAFASGRPSPLAELPIQYGDFAHWQQEWLRGPEPERQLRYWRERLAGAPATLDLPRDRPRPAELTLRGAQAGAALPDRLMAAVEALSRDEGCTVFMTLLAAFHALLHRCSRQVDVLTGVPVAGRPRPETAGLIGFFVNTLVLRSDLSGPPSFRALLGRVREAALGAFANRDLPFETLVAELNPERSLSHAPLFQVGFSLRHAARPAPWAGLDVDVAEPSTGTSKYDLTLNLVRAEDGWAATILYSPDLFAAARPRRLLGHFETLLAGLVSGPDRRIGDVPMLTAAERRQVVSGWNAARRAGAGECVHDLVAAQVARTPDAPAVRFEGEELTYRGLDERANRLARLLGDRGVGPGALVGVCLERSLEMEVALLAVLKAGAAYVPLDPELPEARLRWMVEDAAPALVLTTRPLLARLPAGAGALCLDRDGDLLDGVPADPPDAGARPDDLAYVIYTSGSTGRPKGVEVSHRGVVNLMRWLQERFGLAPGEAVLQKTAFGFDGSFWEFFWPLLAGGVVVLARPGGHRDARYLARVVDEERITTMHLVPGMLAAFARELDGARCRSLRRLICAGEELPPALARALGERAPWIDVLNVYGPTEASIAVSAHLCGDEAGERVPIGAPITGTALYALDGALQPVPPGVPGELCIGGVQVARGYHGRPALTAERFVPDPFGEPGARLYRTGDLVSWLDRGELEYLGRIDRQVKVRGFRVELGEVEAALASHPEVAAAAVVAVDGRLAAYVAPRLEPRDVRRFLRERLPEPMVPSVIVPMAALPVTPGGKVDRGSLPAPAPPDHEPDAFVAPRTSSEGMVASVWSSLLGVVAVGRGDSFFDLGGHSLLLIEAQRRLEAALGREIPLVELFRHPTPSALAGYLDADGERPGPRVRAGRRREPVAIVGMAARMPGAAGIDEFWAHLRAGRDDVRTLTPDDLRAAGVDPALLDEPRYLGRRGVLEGIERFDAAFFDMTPREAEITDPQQRLFLECAWEALEHAGYDVERLDRPVGVFGGSGASTYAARLPAPALGAVQAEIGAGADYLTTRVSYRLGLRGPSVAVQTACSTSLVAVHLACQSLLTGECDMALAGGVAVRVPQGGYRYQEGGILSPDGRCRAFDAGARGTVPGSGVGVVVLKRLAEALADGDRVWAVVLGSAVNNDGGGKVGFTAPSVEGQAEVVAEALAVAGVEASSIGLLEAHGTGTALGDPIEVRALARAFGSEQGERCALGSVKTNIGHLDAASGVAGLIKAVLSLHHREIPASLHFERANPACELERSPFYVNTRLRAWESEGVPRRAGVSSFGIGGTNAHVVLEEAPGAGVGPEEGEARSRLLLLSARTETALEAATDALQACLEEHPELPLADVAYTLQVGRRQFEHRRTLVCGDRQQALSELGSRSPRLRSGRWAGGPRPVVFMFPGQGAQQVGMGRGLYQAEPTFRSWIDRSSELLVPELGLDLRERLWGPGATEEELRQTWLAQPAQFVLAHALARQWEQWGVRPAAMIGHSLGEYVAACLAGVFTLEEGLRLVAVRGRLMQEMEPGAMLGVGLGLAELEARLPGGLEVAAENGRRQCVVSGPAPAVEELRRGLESEGVRCVLLATSHAFHSALQEPVLEPFQRELARVHLRPPRLPFVSNLNGEWIRPDEATDPAYWSRQLRRPVRFRRGLETATGSGQELLLEVGPGTSLSGLARETGHPVVSSMRHHHDPRGDHEVLLEALASLWLAGGQVDWHALSTGQQRRRLPLPTYPFERHRHWVDWTPHTPTASAEPTPHAAGHALDADAPVVGELPAGDAAPRSALEEVVEGVWREHLGIERRIGVTESFFALGGQSLLAIGIAADLRDRLQVRVTLATIFENSTIETLARAVADLGAGELDDMLTEIERLPAEAVAAELAAASRDGVFTDEERGFLTSRELGRLATVGRGGLPHVVPVNYRFNPALGTIDIRGFGMPETLKYRHVRRHELAAFVVDDIVPPDHPRSVEVRGRAEATEDSGGAVIRIHPERIAARGLDGTPVLRSRRAGR